ncbi:MAG: Rieske (2Fe-2S) protein [Pseudomonadota bacterium]
MSDEGELEWHWAANADDVPEGTAKTCSVAGRLVALIHHEGRFSALDNRCPHMGGPLGEGEIEFGRLVCPWHGREYDPFTGACEAYDERVACFAAEVRDDGVYVSLPAAAS